MTRTTALVALLACLLGPAFLLHAQDDPCLRRTLPVNVLDKNGNQVWGLTPADFRAKFRRRPADILSVIRDTRPHRIVLVLDLSGSMMKPRKKEWAIRATENAVLHMPPQFSLALLTFSDDVLDEAPFGAGRQLILQKLDHIKKQDNASDRYKRTALLDTLMEAIKLLEPRRSGEAIYVITDGGDNVSDTKKRQLVQAAVDQGVRIYGFLIFGPLETRASPEPYRGRALAEDIAEPYRGRALAEDIAEDSGGRLTVVGTDLKLKEKQGKQLLTHLQNTYHMLAEFYQLEIRLPGRVDKPRKWKLEVVDAGGKRRKDLKVIYPRRLFPCPADPTQ